ncbi:MAG: Flp pilus assembly protein CpaB [Dethiobacter sp.]|jgi:pilus assembly protein CpaB|nr:Flp pilus assembly protein CpaB [Dethiobacter sp.]
MKGKKLLLLSVILALIAAGLVFRYLKEMEETSKQAANLVPVVVAKAEIPARTKLDETMFTTVNVSITSVHADAIVNREEIRGAFALERLIANEQVLKTRLVYGETKAGMSYKISEGHRALTLPVSTVTGVAGFILPGDRVDVVVTLELEQGSENITLTTVVVQNIRVLAMGAQIYDPKKEQLPADSTTLDVPNEYVTKLIQAAERGSIRLVLRPAVDDSNKPLPDHQFKQFLPR